MAGRRGRGRPRKPLPPGEELPFFARQLTRLRLRAGLTQAQLADAAGLTPGHVWNLETGQYAPRWGTVESLARALGVKPSRFLEE